MVAPRALERGPVRVATQPLEQPLDVRDVLPGFGLDFALLAMFAASTMQAAA